MILKNLREAVDEMYDFITDLPSTTDGFESNFNAAFGELEEVESEDVVRVIRCKDCKHGFERSGRKPFGCYLHGKNGITLHDGDDFCSYGERKTIESE